MLSNIPEPGRSFQIKNLYSQLVGLNNPTWAPGREAGRAVAPSNKNLWGLSPFHDSMRKIPLNAQYELIWHKNMLGYLSTDIICSEERTVSWECSSRKTVSFEEQIMSKDKYRSIFSPPNGGYRVYYPSNLFRNASCFENWGIFLDIYIYPKRMRP